MGIFSDLFDAFTGDAQRDDLEAGATEATRLRQEALARTRGELTGARDTAIETITPDLETGRAAEDQFLTALGLRGREAQQTFFNEFQTDPGFQAETDAGIEAIGRSASARGLTLSGRTLKELQDFGQLRKRSAFSERLDRLAQLGQRATQTRTNIANLQFGTGQTLADIEFGTGQQEAGQAINLANVRAETRGIPLTNLVELGKVGAKIAAEV